MAIRACYFVQPTREGKEAEMDLDEAVVGRLLRVEDMIPAMERALSHGRARVPSWALKAFLPGLPSIHIPEYPER